ncbi:unnamed protein product [Symbiodinium natans]|uniref:Right handed beta helix domain-containing protein n=1 Tax=Symbiodinium natans TaxID=878477 RepID=A0A812PGQ7_9DINO|nr:unnamed protein product [Symbiodinium natans]
MAAAFLYLLLPLVSWSLAGGQSCTHILPTASAQVNYNTIVGCLRGEQQAGLSAGTFLLPHGIRLPPNTTLFGVPPNASSAELMSRLVLAVPTAITHYLLLVGSHSEVSGVVLDARDNLLGEGCCKCVLCIYGNFSQVSNVEAMGTSTGVGVHFESPTSRGNTVSETSVRACFYGVAFASGLSARQANAFERGVLENVLCDAVSFAGYGEVRLTTIRRSGYACRPPGDGEAPAGAGFFCRGNWDGAIVHANQVVDTCGMALDVDSCSHLDIFNNTFSGPGYDWDGNFTHCWGALAASLLDSQMCSVSRNLMSNGRESNRLGMSHGDQHQVFSELATAPFSDLPNGTDTVLTFALLHRPHAGAKPSINNEISNNSFTSRCAGENATCVGLAYFVGRGTGLEGRRLPGHAWGERGPKQPSRFTGNVEDADVGSVRCGENAYAAAEPVCRIESDWPCNADDYQHPKENFRNNLHCQDYVDVIHDRPVDQNGGGLRQPLPIVMGQGTPRWEM